jgi:hypothetical protein
LCDVRVLGTAALGENCSGNWWFTRLVKESAATGDDAVSSSRGIVRLDEK